MSPTASGDRPEPVTREINMLCPTCEGMGRVGVVQTASLGGEPCQIRSTRPCADCQTAGHRPLAPPL
ncbi:MULTISPECIES: hypothetical protein [Protofrankia]|uniref:Molecular chaperone DnaJ n=1 Tax=Protofrankia coriariae TaxID=1562887 RepID=A0ABR5F5N4_9ACTN|nr:MULTISPECIES: hypothetical protein [Protofrankia]KLL12041.1 hypothetical protein FrCorBMG51_07180 [Protofrankia coriariae]ONH35330.1 hypothetical protein BL254_11670 [Protofrankia sp. BMG5.30]